MAPTLSTSSFSSLLIYFFPVTWQEKVIHLNSDFSLYYFFKLFFGFHVSPLSFPSGSTPPILGVHSHLATTSLERRTAPHPGASGFTSWQSRSGTLGVQRPEPQCSTAAFYTFSGCSWVWPVQSPQAPVFWSEMDMKTEKEASLWGVCVCARTCVVCANTMGKCHLDLQDGLVGGEVQSERQGW